MDLGTAIIGIICVAVCAMPFVLTNRSRKKRERQLLESIKELAKQQNCKMTQHETCGNYIIGIDETKNFLFFQSNTQEETKQQIVDLSIIANCNISRKNLKNQTVERLDLELTPTDKNKPKIVLEFYNVDLSYQSSGELESIEKWNKLIKKRLTENK
ncbi:MAG: hypothetical protein KDC97_13165 [Confluentibacter sp.]|nr:hypothetical protein [Confluentibacter sp.]